MNALAPKAFTGRRFQKLGSHAVSVGRPMSLDRDHPAIREGRTLFPSRVYDPSEEGTVLKSGQHSRKIGGRILKGRWAGLPVFTLTLEERATCPRSCAVWDKCYGNRTNWAHRLKHGPALEARLASELAELNRRHPGGFVVRLHQLGDFYSIPYVRRWARWLADFPALRVYGYTAWGPETEIGREVARLRDHEWSRFSVRTSGPHGLKDAFSLVIGTHDPVPADAVVCPMQEHRTDCCATCGLCWQTRDGIAFREH